MLILKNVRLYGFSKDPNSNDALAIQNGLITAIGRLEDVLSISDRKSEIMDLHGKTIMPGFTDSHLHLQLLAKSLSMVNCETKSSQICFERLKKKAIVIPRQQWILGHGWNQNDWENGFEALELLHQVSNDHPIYLTAKSLHAAWANKIALKLAGITKETPDPVDGVIGRDSLGNPNGLLFENAMRLMDDFIPSYTGKTLENGLLAAQKELWKVGITSVHDFDGADCFSALQNLDINQKLKLRVLKSIPLHNLDAAIKSGLKTGFGSSFLRIGPIKMFADGALGPQTAAMLHPYENNSSNSGILMLSTDEILQYGRLAVLNGLTLAIHAIGDRANHVVLNAYEQIRKFESVQNITNLNHRIEHVQILSENDLSRLSENKIVASMQPIHLISDMDTADQFWGERSRFAYAFKSLQKNKTLLIFGSDAPVESYNPFIGIYAALTRRKYDQPKFTTGWYPQEKITLREIINAYTINPAISSRIDKNLGSISNGKFADLIVLSNDLHELSADEIKETTPIGTMVSGQWVWQNEEF